MTERADPTALKITNQFRARTGFVYDLKADGVRLTLTISQRQGNEEPGDWFVGAKTSSAPDAAAIEAWGATRIDTLREVARLWDEKSLELHLPRFDWDAVAKALSDVRAV
jgi:hypothetical protein